MYKKLKCYFFNWASEMKSIACEFSSLAMQHGKLEDPHEALGVYFDLACKKYPKTCFSLSCKIDYLRRIGLQHGKINL